MAEKSFLIIEDDAQIKNFIGYILNSNGYKYIETGTAKEALEELSTKKIDFIILDLGLPDLDGVLLLKKIRQHMYDIPIIVVSARDQDQEKADVLDLGADDYLTKPFSAMELLARIRVALRHYSRLNTQNIKNEIVIGELKIDIEKRKVHLYDNEIHLTPMEYGLLFLLMKNAGKVLTSAYIIKELWGVEYGDDTQALRTLMAGVRRKIEKNSAKPKYIITEMGVGYRMVDEI